MNAFVRMKPYGLNVTLLAAGGVGAGTAGGVGGACVAGVACVGCSGAGVGVWARLVRGSAATEAARSEARERLIRGSSQCETESSRGYGFVAQRADWNTIQVVEPSTDRSKRDASRIRFPSGARLSSPS